MKLLYYFSCRFFCYVFICRNIFLFFFFFFLYFYFVSFFAFFLYVFLLSCYVSTFFIYISTFYLSFSFFLFFLLSCYTSPGKPLWAPQGSHLKSSRDVILALEEFLGGVGESFKGRGEVIFRTD